MTKHPNVLILFTDQQRYDTIHYAGHEHMITPNLDRLAEEGCLYRFAHSTNPVCMPARHDLMTGLSGRAHGYFENGPKPIKDYSIPTLPRIFSENGYRTAAIGKMHFCPKRMHHGFDEMYLMEELPKSRQIDQYAQFLKENGLVQLQNIHGVRPHIYHLPQNALMEEKYHGSTWVADKVIEWLENNQENPFFLIAGWIHPHPPWGLPPEYQSLYKEKNIPEPIPLSREFPFRKQKSNWYGDWDTEEEKRNIRKAYFGAVTMTEHNIGRVLDYLKEKGTIDDTLIIFTSDHGEMLQDKGLYTKSLPYESSVRIPMIVRYPESFEPGITKDDFVDLFDVLPTCLDVCGLSYADDKQKLAGNSLCNEEIVRSRKYQTASFGTGKKRWVMVREERYKYIYWYNGGTEEMYDMKNDPQEINNILRCENYPLQIYNELKTRAIEYEKEWGPEECIQNNNMVELESELFVVHKGSKFPAGSNSQFQYFDERTPDERGEQFLKEIESAYYNELSCNKCLNEVNNEKKWRENFQGNWKKFGGNVKFENKLFK